MNYRCIITVIALLSSGILSADDQSTPPDFETVAKIRDAVAIRCDWGSASAQIGMGIFTDDWKQLEKLLDADENAVMCQGAAYALHMKYESLEYRSYLIGMKNSEYSHAMCLVEILTKSGLKKLIVMDPSFNISFTNSEGVPLSIHELIAHTHAGEADKVKVVEGAPVHVNYLHSKKDPLSKSQTYREEFRTSTETIDIYNATLSIERFAKAYRSHIERFCKDAGLPVSVISATFGGTPIYVYCTYPMSSDEKREADAVLSKILSGYEKATAKR